MANAPHIWKNAEIKTIGDLVDAMSALQTREEAQEFMAGYVAVNEHAYVNFGYCTGYLGHEQGQRLRGWCEAPHPVFGMGTPTPAEALNAGMEAARSSG